VLRFSSNMEEMLCFIFHKLLNLERVSSLSVIRNIHESTRVANDDTNMFLYVRLIFKIFMDIYYILLHKNSCPKIFLC
jgi:hypothetical protein